MLASSMMLNGTPEDATSKNRAAEERGAAAARSRRVFKFGEFELRTETGELFKRGIRVKAQAKPLQILEALIERSGQLVTREELCKKLWPSGTFVDFENGLNTATNRLRAALNDSAEAPRYIETLPRLGYRFICPVAEIVEDASATASADTGVQVSSRVPETSVVQTTSAPVFPNEPGAPELRRAGLESYRSSVGLRTLAIAAGVIALMALAFAYVFSGTNSPRGKPTFRQLTFRAGVVGCARFTPDLKKIIYTARWGNGGAQTYLLDLKNSKAEALQFAAGSLTSVSRKGDVAFVSHNADFLKRPARLCKVSANGGTAELVAEGGKAGDWSPDGRQLAIIRDVGPRNVIEFPVGNVIYSSQGWINSLRVSPRGDRIAFLEHPVRDDDAGQVRVVDTRGGTKAGSEDWNSIDGLAWAPSGKEVWFTASKKGAVRALYALTASSQVREIAESPSSLRLLDISRTGRVLVAADSARMSLRGAPDDTSAEKDLSNFDFSHADDISPDGNVVLFTNGGDGGGQHYSAYVHDEKSGKAFRIGPGRGLSISPDAKMALTVDPQDRTSLAVVTLDSHHTAKIAGNGFQYQWAKFLQDGKTLLVGGAYARQPLRICTQRLDGGRPMPIEGVPYMDFVTVSSNGLRLAGVSGNQATLVFELAGDAARQISSLTGTIPIAWGSDNSELYALTLQDSVYSVVKKNLLTGKAELWKTIDPEDRAGVIGLAGLVIAPGSGAYAYSTSFDFSRLYLVDGWS